MSTFSCASGSLVILLWILIGSWRSFPSVWLTVVITFIGFDFKTLNRKALYYSFVNCMAYHLSVCHHNPCNKLLAQSICWVVLGWPVWNRVNYERSDFELNFSNKVRCFIFLDIWRAGVKLKKRKSWFCFLYLAQNRNHFSSCFLLFLNIQLSWFVKEKISRKKEKAYQIGPFFWRIPAWSLCTWKTNSLMDL